MPSEFDKPKYITKGTHFNSDAEKHSENKKSAPSSIAAFLRVFFIVSFVLIVLFELAIALPGYFSYRKRGYDSAANADIKNAYAAAKAYFIDHPSGEISNNILEQYGYKPTENVRLDIINKEKNSLRMTTVHKKGDKTYTIDAGGKIGFEVK